MGKMFEVLQNMGEAFQYMAAKQGRHHYDSDLDEPVAKIAKASVSEPLNTSKAHDISHNVSNLFVICLSPSPSKSMTLMLTSWMTLMTPLLWLTKLGHL